MKNSALKLRLFNALLLCIFSLPLFSQSEQKYKIIFSTRGAAIKPFSLTGHAFVTFAITDKNEREIEKQTFGFFPTHNSEDADESAIATVLGEVKEGFDANNTGNKATLYVTYWLDEKAWKLAKSSMKPWKKANYSFFKSNCVTFMADVVKASGLKSPKTLIKKFIPVYPTAYLKMLMRMNKENPNLESDDVDEDTSIVDTLSE